jgi:anti-sigma regulatory factor (Ser/Thr protein kinase)
VTRADEITLILPAERGFYRVAHLVLGGLAVRLNLTFESLEDLQLALGEILDTRAGDGSVTVSVSVQPGRVEAVVGPFSDDRLRRELEPGSAEDLSLRRVLDAVVDGVALEEGPDGQWVRLTKRVDTLAAAAGA